MLMQYEFYPLKDGATYPFVDGKYSEIVYDMTNEDLFDIVREDAIIIKTIDQVLNAGYLDQYSKDVIRKLFSTNPKCYFVYNEEQERYCVLFLFTDEEKNQLSKNFQSILQHLECIVAVNSNYISLNDINKKDAMFGDDYIGSFWLYSLSFSKKILEENII